MILLLSPDPTGPEGLVCQNHKKQHISNVPLVVSRGFEICHLYDKNELQKMTLK